MRRTTSILAMSASLLALAVLGAPPVRATSDDERPGEIGFLAGIGLGDKSLVGDANDTHINGLIGGRFAWHFTPHVSGYLDVTWVPLQGASTLFGDVSEYAYRVGPEWYVNPHSRWQFFVNLGMGAMELKSDTGGNDGRGFVSGGLGVRRGWRPGAFRIELRGDHTVSSADKLGATDVTQAKLVMGWTWGIGARPTDSDGDGVFDKKDKCPDTPRGAVVDADGCPKDADGDGVFDGIDTCPDTPKGYPVDASGCPKDEDGDGVVDGIDKCPDTPKGCTVDANGCPSDSDGDGVCDGLDQCAATPQGCRVDSRGCPIDSDGDGVCDGLDQCPGTPAGTTVDAKGCPPPKPTVAPIFTAEQKEFVLEGVNFDTGKYDLKPEATEILDRVAESLKAFPDMKVEVGGHTDNVGGQSFNQKLSEQRAKSVRDYLVSKGVDPGMLTFKGYGKNGPIADNKTAEGRAKNRRVELHKLD
jgi:outer membrane protein OmpA-like peptidoglycan-associated protein